MYLKEDGALGLHRPLAPRGVIQILVLVVGEGVMHLRVQHHARVRNSYGFSFVGHEGVVFGKGLRQNAPDPIGIQFQRPAEVFHQLACLFDEGGARVGDDARHFHRAPPCPSTHNVPIERVQNALVRELGEYRHTQEERQFKAFN